MSKTETQVVEATLPERNYQHISLDQDIILGWHQITSASANSTVEERLVTTDVNVVSPTWFYLNDNKGGIANLASASYVEYCHQNNIQVWGLVSNLENSNVDTTTVLNTTSSRDNLVNNLIAAAITYNLDGINVDMEALSIQAKDGYILSVDNYVPTASTAFYNRSVQADYADYIIIMAYDEHTSGSEEAGSVSSVGFVENGIKDTLEEVPAEQVILGLPFYARVWAVSGDTISSSAYGMKELSDYLDANGASKVWSETDGQYYAEFVKGDTTYQCWVEDAASLSRKLELMQDNNLAGAAFWKLGFETNEIWTTIDNYLK
jgi:spore germination protein YaaH